MEQDIPIGMSAKSFVMFELDAANFQRNSGTELVGVESVANANRKFRVLSFEFRALFKHLWDLSSSWRTGCLFLKVELREFHVCRARDLDISRRAHHHCDFISRAFHQRGFIGSEKSIGRCFVECLLDYAVPEALRGLCHHYALTRDCRLNQRTVGCALDLLHGIDGGQARDSCPVFSSCFDYFPGN